MSQLSIIPLLVPAIDFCIFYVYVTLAEDVCPISFIHCIYSGLEFFKLYEGVTILHKHIKYSTMFSKFPPYLMLVDLEGETSEEDSWVLGVASSLDLVLS